jgi:hypothetical protein
MGAHLLRTTIAFLAKLHRPRQALDAVTGMAENRR